MPQLAPSSLPPGPTMAGPLLVWESGATLSVHGLTVAHSGSRPIQCRLAAATSGRAYPACVRTRQSISLDPYRPTRLLDSLAGDYERPSGRKLSICDGP